MKLFLPFYFLVLLSALVSCGNEEINHTTSRLDCHLQLSNNQLKEDFNILTTTLEEIHPDLYRVSSKEELDNRIQLIQQKINDSLSYLEFLKLIAPLLTDIGCINTQWGHSKEYINFRNDSIPIFPLLFQIKGNRFFITKNFSEDSSITIGDEIIAINSVKVSDYLRKNYPLLPIDGRIQTLQNRWLESYFPQHHSNFWEQTDTFQLELSDDQDNLYTKRITALKRREFIKPDEKKERLFQYKTIDSMAALTVKSFHSKRIEFEQLDYSNFLDSCFELIKKNNIQKVILDLRENSWGNLTLGAELYSYLTDKPFRYVRIKEPDLSLKSSYDSLLTPIEQLDSLAKYELEKTRNQKPSSFTGKVYLITNGWNVNAGGYFCSKIKDRPNTFFVGEKPGASLFGMNAILTHFILPNSGINVYLPMYQFIVNPEKMKDSLGIHMDLELDSRKSLGQIIDKIGKGGL